MGTVRAATKIGLTHPYRLAVIAATLFIATSNLYMSPKPGIPAIVALVAAYVLSVMAYWFPTPCCVILLVFTCVGEYAVPMFGLYDPFFMFLCVGLLAYETTNASASVICLLMSLYTVAEGFLRPEALTWYGVFAFITFFLLLTLLGCGLRWNRERTEELRTALHAQAELHVLKSRQQLALQLHDGLSRHLGVISMAARSEANNGGADAGEWSLVADSSHAALLSLRDIIDLLEQDQPQDGMEAMGIFESHLRHELQEGDTLLHGHGFKGKSRMEVRGGIASMPSRPGSLLLTTVHEAYTNIAKHGDPGTPYAMLVTIGPESAEISYHNGIAEHEDREAVPGGHGLPLTAKVIEDIGGSVTHEVREGVWQGTVALPVAPQPQSAA